ncbi:phosphatidate cytidylyltransferase [Treponema sp. OMZ 840]|uniref:diacylglycerol/polyprenol kinase family protein n=1 Tax=Treponema sp. OMZ 840 TaxID=244313 RepID=UPI003D8C027B
MSKFHDGRESGVLVRRYTNDKIKELFRKSIHLCSALVPPLLARARIPVLCALCAVLFFYCVAEFLRMRGFSVFLVSKITEAAARKRDENRFVLGPVCLALGILITEILFDAKAAAVGIYALAFGDGLASLAGKMFGITVIPHTAGKTVIGSLTCFTAIFLSSWAVSGSTFAALIIAVCGMAIELIPLKDFDNLIIPIVSAFIAQFYFHI